VHTRVADVSGAYAQLNLQGPRSRELLQSLTSVDLGNAAYPFHMGVRDGKLAGMPARVFRISFSGEMAYEVHVPAHHGDAMIRHLFAAGHSLEVVPYGTEALGVMRIEKGDPAGNELNGQTTAADLGMGRMMSRKKDYIGRIMADRSGLSDPARPTLVGLKPVDRTQRLRAGAHLLPPGATAVAANDEGYVTSAAWSPTLGHSIALALLARGPERHGERIILHDPMRGGDIEAEICDPVFVDPEGARVRG